jgi:hypothetical protein
MTLYLYGKDGDKLARVNPHKNMKLPNGDHVSGASIKDGWKHDLGYYAAIEVLDVPEQEVPPIEVSAYQALATLADFGVLEGLMAQKLPPRVVLFIERAPIWVAGTEIANYVLGKADLTDEELAGFWPHATGVV